MKTLVVVGLAAVLLVGCNEAPQVGTEQVPAVRHANTLYKDTIYFPDGSGVTFSGYVGSYALIQNDKGIYDRYIINFDQEIMEVEGAVYASLAKSGYQRKVYKEESGLFIVNYLKKDYAPVSFTYSDFSEESKGAIKTQVRAVWKLDK